MGVLRASLGGMACAVCLLSTAAAADRPRDPFSPGARVEAPSKGKGGDTLPGLEEIERLSRETAAGKNLGDADIKAFKAVLDRVNGGGAGAGTAGGQPESAVGASVPRGCVGGMVLMLNKASGLRFTVTPDEAAAENPVARHLKCGG